MSQQEQQQSSLKELIARGKEQGYLTYAEVNDHLPDTIVDPEQIEDIVAMINDMGITVFENAPDADALLLNDDTVQADDEAAEEAAAALANVDSDFGRTTDPVRMYMREMGTVELLTREGEIQIAIRIEEGLNEILRALAQYPASTEVLLVMAAQIEAELVRLTDVINGFVDPNAVDESPLPPVATLDTDDDSDSAKLDDSSDSDDDESSDEDDEEEILVDTGPDPEEAALKFSELQVLFQTAAAACERNDERSYAAARESMAAKFMEFRLAQPVIDRLTLQLNRIVDRIRGFERRIMKLCVQRGGMSRQAFIDSFPQNETDVEWLDRFCADHPSGRERLLPLKEQVVEAQQQLREIEIESSLSISQIK
ncbi:MAG: RNA polymerase sigma factor RpoD, partial [Thiothrix sp.]|nr:RNA polymerase sigma factor RpoD [Thiothrix sp.]